jgi:hypothetical protein
MPLPKVKIPIGLRYLKPTFIPHNSQLTPPTKVNLNILESSHGELLFAQHFILVVSSFYG